MAFEQVMPRRLARWVAAEPDWDQVYAEELPRVLNFFRYRFGDTADAEDLTARTFEKAWRARHRYRDVAGFATWLLTIARNVAIDHVRARRPHVPSSMPRRPCRRPGHTRAAARCTSPRPSGSRRCWRRCRRAIAS